ncbi:VOC family protein [Cellulomonas denverensis]|uniref:VOC family protein n=1 Tax=Cellulomonas denverensis TaxID=264297 RepID=A0A7X6KYE3_9CELL|nr:VOC family protein [Cellulomonas denverensis]NKY24480.1 VOC family protein [Cellulomonas denverensis]GIG25397.1 glyoxalase [Cellulomonas denverensis]
MTTSTPQDRLAADTAMGPVTLLVGDLDLQLRYYRDVLGLTVVERPDERIDRVGRPDVVVLGRGSSALMVLRHTPDLPPTQRSQAGLFHTAILFDTREALAATLASVAARAPQTYIGSADHLVSEAFYLTDPEGNGVELYWDRGRDTWQYDADGHVVMDSLLLDPNDFIRRHGDDASLGRPGIGRPVVGHVHLQVGDVPSARSFYVDALGFDVTAEWHGALFVSAGGYHHHLAVNTWNSAGAGPRASSLGLGEVTLVVPGSDDIGALRERLGHHGVGVQDDGATVTFTDPWRNVVRVRAAA